MSDISTPEQFEQLFRRYHAPLCDVVFGIVQSRAVAEEIVQDLFLVLWTQRLDLVVRGSLSAYLFTAARNRALTHIKHQTVVRRSLDHNPGNESLGMSEAPLPIDARVEMLESIQALHKAISGLPERSRLALLLRWRHQLSYAEVAEAMGISVKGVEKLLSIAMRHLRTVLLDGER